MPSLTSLFNISSILLQIALNINLLVLAWIFYMILQYCWSGMSKFISILLFPGAFLHTLSHYLLAKLLNIRPYMTLSIIPTEDYRAGLYVTAEIYRLNLWKVGLVAMAPLVTSLPVIILLKLVLEIAIGLDSHMVALFLAWLLISIFVCGLPSAADLGFIASNIVVKRPDVMLASLLSPIIYVVGALAYNNEIATYGTMLYIILVVIASLLGESQRKEIVID